MTYKSKKKIFLDQVVGRKCQGMLDLCTIPLLDAETFYFLDQMIWLLDHQYNKLSYFQISNFAF